MFHHIDDGDIVKKSGCVLDRESFLYIIDSGLSFVDPIELVQNKKNRSKCSITFDDGLQDVYRVAYPELKKRNIPFAVFIVTDFLDREGYISTSELIEMSKDPLVTIGSHGVTHEIMNGMNIAKQLEELRSSKEILEGKIGKKVEMFAYSHGQYDRNTISLLKKYKIYKCAFGVHGLPLNCVTKMRIYDLPRVNCENGVSTFDIVKTKNTVMIKKRG